MLKTGHRTKYHLRAFEFLAARRRSRAVLTCTLLASFLATMPTGGLQAGDILRGGASAGNAKRNSEARAQAGAEAAQAAKVRAQDRLARTTKAVNDMRALQASARAAAQSNTIPNGLIEGGLNPIVGGTWTGANPATASGNNVNITQTAAQALLHWRTFNVGSQTTLNFDQSAGGADSGKWIAFNKVFDPDAKPSEIHGKITAQGQVYIINQNGIVFGAGSQVNTRALVASTLPINDNLVTNGLLNNKDAQFLFSSLIVPGGADGTPAFTPMDVPTRVGDVVVERGALLQTPASADGNGGRIMLVGANVRNEGQISTPSGQSILAAGLQVGVRAHAESDPSLRGLDVWVGSVGSYGGTVTNSGLIDSQTGSIVVVGKNINQFGNLESSTSVNLNGRIDLLASYGAVGNPNFDKFSGSQNPPFLSQFTGIVRIGEGSTTRILPDLSSSKKIPGTTLAQNSQINIEGLGIHLASGSSLVATSGDIRIRAGMWPFRDTDGDGTTLAGSNDQSGLSQQLDSENQKFLLSGGQVNVSSGALIDASGTMNAFVPLDQNLITVQMRGSELADSPLQRKGGLRGKPLLVDMRRSGTYGGREWVGTPLGDLTGFANITERDISQLTTRGGTISISAGDSVVTGAGSMIDVSGGFLTNEGGLVRTTRLLRDANLVDIYNAVPDVDYDGVYNGIGSFASSKWGVSKTFTHALAPLGGSNEKSYVEGAAAGTLAITAPKMALAGELFGQSIKGPRQQSQAAAQGTLNLTFRGETQQNTSSSKFVFLNQSPSAPAITFQSKPTSSVPQFEIINGVPAAYTFTAGSTFAVNTDWWEEEKGGFGNLIVENSEGDIIVPQGNPVTLPPGGRVSLSGRNIFVLDSITAPGGAVSLTAYNFTPLDYARQSALGAFTDKPAPLPIAGQGTVRLAKGVSINVAGMFVDERPTSSMPYQSSYVLKGGTASVTAYSIVLEKESSIDASGGLRARPNGKFQYGNGGSISLLAGKDPQLSTTVGGQLVMDGTLQAYSAAKGGSLALQAPLVQIGGDTAPTGTLHLKPDFFQKGGFTSYSVAGIGGRSSDGSFLPAVSVVAGTTIEPIAQSWRHLPYANMPSLIQTLGKNTEYAALLSELNTGGDAYSNGLRLLGNDALIPVLQPVGIRSATSLSLAGAGYDDGFTEDRIEGMGIVSLESGAKIKTDPGASVRITGDLVRIDSEISAPGGSIEISGRSSFRVAKLVSENASFAIPTVLIASKSKLSVAGTVVSLEDPYGWNSGIIHPGGTIKISGNILAESGSVLDASGTTGVLDFHPSRVNPELVTDVPENSGLNSTPWGRKAVSVRVDSDGGRIELTGSQMLYVDSTLLGTAGGKSALGGTLSISSGKFYRSSDSRTGADTNLYIGASGSSAKVASPASLASTVSSFLQSKTPETHLETSYLNPPTETGVGFFAIDKFVAGGFDYLDLGYKYFESASPIPYGGNLEFLEPVSINAKGAVRLAGGGVIRNTHPVSISAPYVAIGQEFRPPLNAADIFQPFREFNSGTGATPIHNFAPTSGAGTLAINANLIDVGTLVTQGVKSLSLTAKNGDIRGNGILSVAGDITLTAAQIYPTALANFDIFAYDPTGGSGSVTIQASGTRQLPLSAGGTLRVFAKTITQAGTLRAPIGSITLGWDGTTSSKPENAVVGTKATLPKTNNLNLASGSSTSVSGVDPTTGAEISIPFGISPDGLSWIDPRGQDITVSGLPSRGVTLASNSVSIDSAATIDLRGGGDLVAYRWIPGIGGSADLLGTATKTWSSGNSYTAGDLVSHSGKTWSARRDLDPADFTTAPEPSESRYWSIVPESYAILPGSGINFAPFNAFNTGTNSGALAGDPGFVSSSLRTGEQVYLPPTGGLSEGLYTLLPRRYGILPGAYLIVPQSGSLANTSAVRSTKSLGLKGSLSNTGIIAKAEGSEFVSGYTVNGLNTPSEKSPIHSRFEVVPYNVLKERSKYDLYRANSFLSAAANRLDLSEVQMLPKDSAPLQIQGNNRLSLGGTILAPSIVGGRGARVDIGSDANIYILGGEGAAPGGINAILSTSVLNSWKADSLFIGGLREKSSTGTTASIRTNSITVANAGETLTAPDITLASKSSITLYAGSSLASSGPLSTSAETIAIVGDGSLLRVSGDSLASITRTAATSASAPSLSIGANARIAGKGVILDSTNASLIAPSLNLSASALSLGSGQISVLFEPQTTGLEGSVVNNHLTLQGDFLKNAFASNSLTLQSYRTIDFYGSSPSSFQLNSLQLLSSGVRGYTSAGTNIQLNASDVLLSNPNSAAGLTNPGTNSGRLGITAQNIGFGQNSFAIAGFNSLDLTATNGARTDSKGSFSTSGSLSLSTSLLTASRGASYNLAASSTFDLVSTGGSSNLTPGLGASLNLTGSSVSIASNISLPSGSLIATASSGDIIVSGTLGAEGTSQKFYDLTRFTDAGAIELNAKAGKVTLANGSRVSVAASSAGGNAGSLTIKSPRGIFVNDGIISGTAGLAGLAGTFSLDAGTIASFADISSDLASSGFSREQNIRVRNGDITINGNLAVQKFSLSTDNGGVFVNGRIDASAATGGRIELIARNNLVLASGSELTVAANRFSNAGKGGHIHLEAGSAINGIANTSALLDIQSGSKINLSVAEYIAGDYLTEGSSAFLGKFQGTLHLRAPRNGNDVRIDPIDGAITGASAVIVEPFRVYEPTSGVMNIALRNSIHADNTSFIDAGGTPMATRLGGGLGNKLVVTPGVEILNKSGDLTLGLLNNSNLDSTNAEALSSADWDLSSFRYGSQQAPGVLTLRASGDLVFNNSLSDGFTPVLPGDSEEFNKNGHSQMWLAAPQTINTSLPTNLQSWSYRLAAGSDMTSASHLRTASADALVGKGSILVGEFYPSVPNTNSSGTAPAIGQSGQTANTIRISTTATDRGTRYEVVRTGTGNIEIAAAKDVQLRNPFSTIYTSGIALPTPSRIFKSNDFSLPIVAPETLNPAPDPLPAQDKLGALQQAYNPSYTMAGGSIVITAGNDLGRFTQSGGVVVPDASRQLPTKWLYRRGQVDPATGLFATGGVGTGDSSFTDTSASTTWWVDFSNYFGGFGALGGGSVSLSAGRDLINADAAVPTNARMAGLSNGQRIAPSMDKFQELGGGDLNVSAGRNIDGGSFHVERGTALLNAGSEVTTNSAQSPSRGLMGTSGQSPLIYDKLVWQPVTLFGSRSDFTVSARSNILLGPITNAFLLPQGLNNKFWYKTQFNTIDSKSGASVNSFGGSITHRLAVSLTDVAIPTLELVYRQSAIVNDAAGFFRPWVRIAELDSTNFRTAASVALPTLRSTAHGGNLNVIGSMNLFPSQLGGVELLAFGDLSGINPSGVTTAMVNGSQVKTTAWITSSINLSDTNPGNLPSILSPYSIQTSLNSRVPNTLRDTTLNPFSSFNDAFAETGSFAGDAGSIDVKSGLHQSTPVHSGNPTPLRLYASTGDLTGLTLYSAKKIQAIAGRDITDIAFYLQHTGPNDISIVSAGRDVIPFNENSNLRALANSTGNKITDQEANTVVKRSANEYVKSKTLPGDIQIGGQGVLEVLAGRNIDLGTGPNLLDGRGKGITSIGRSRNPFLPFDGAELVIIAGVGGKTSGPALGLANSALDFSGLASGIATTELAAVATLKTLFKDLAQIGEAALETNDYSKGFALINSLFRTVEAGNLLTRARDIRTSSGGSITIAAPGGGVTMASDIFGNPLTPPGIVTEYGGAVSILTNNNVDIGQARIFTLRGGDLTIWSSKGDIAAGNAPKTVVTAPPTRVLIDATSADIQTDLGGLATGGGIGVLAAVEGVKEGAVNLIAPGGTVDAGDAGIRATGDIKIAAAAVVNADNISAGGTSAGVPTAPTVAAPNIGGLTSGSSSSAAASSAASQVSQQAKPQEKPVEEAPSLITVEVLGYGGGDRSTEEEETQGGG